MSSIFSPQSLFERYKLSKSESDWLKVFYNSTGFEPMYCEGVINQETFVEMVDANVSWFERWASDQHTIIDRARRAIKSYEKHKQ